MMARILAVLLLLAPVAAQAQVVARGLETFPATGIRLVPVGGAPGASLCTSATDGRIAYDGGLVYLCDAGTWVSLGPTAALSTTTAASFTINSDADGTATEDAALRLKAQSLGLGIAADAVLTSAIAASPPGIALYYDTPVDQYLYLGPPGDALGAGDLEAGLRLRSHTSGDPVGTVKEGLVRHSAAGILVLDGFVAVQSADALDVQGNLTLTGTVDGRDVAADGVSLDGVVQGLADHLADAVDAHDASAVSADPTGLTYATGTTVQAHLGQLDGQLVTATTTANAGDALAESVATDHAYVSPLTIHWPGANQDISFGSPTYDATDHEVYTVGTASLAAQSAALHQCWVVPQRSATPGAASSAQLVYKTTGTATVGLEVIGTGGAQCESPSYVSSASKTTISIGAAALDDCVTAAGGLVCLRAWCDSGATSGTCSLGRMYPRWER